jgi:hypothetical protein
MSDTSGSANAPASPPAPDSDTPAGYLTPEEQARRDSQDKQADIGLNQNLANQYRKRAAQDDAANAAAAGGGFELDIDAVRRFQPRWQALADRLLDARRQGQQFSALNAPATDDGSDMVGSAAKRHASAYLEIVTAQHAAAAKYAADLQTAIDSYGEQEQAAADAAAKHGRKM